MICMVSAYINTTTELFMKENTKMTKKQVTAYTSGQMAVNTKDGGTKASNMASVSTRTQLKVK